jgi:Holliday junction resolvase RusA-like endonuclease
MKLILDMTLLGWTPVPWSVPTVGSSVTKSGRRFSFVRRDKKSDPWGDSLNLEDWQMLVRREGERAGIEPATSPVAVAITFVFETPPGHRHGAIVTPLVKFNHEKRAWVKHGPRLADLTNLAKGTEDALEGVAYVNDVLIRKSTHIALYGPRPGVRVTVSVIEAGDYPGTGDPVPEPEPLYRSRRCPRQPAAGPARGRSATPSPSPTPSATGTGRSRRKPPSVPPPTSGSGRSGPSLSGAS